MRHGPFRQACALAAALGLGSPAMAQIVVPDGQVVCYGKAYGWHELDSAPHRQVSRLGLTFETWEGSLYFGFEVVFRSRSGLVFGGGGRCHERDTGYMCANDGDGGTILVTPAPDGGIDVRTDEYGMQLYSAAFESAASLEQYGEYHPDGIEAFRTSDGTMPVHHLVALPSDYCN